MVGLLAPAPCWCSTGGTGAGSWIVTLAFAVKATAGVALPFLVVDLDVRLDGSPRRRFATAAGNGAAVVVPRSARVPCWPRRAGLGFRRCARRPR